MKKLLMLALPLLISGIAKAQTDEAAASPAHKNDNSNIIAIAPIQFTENGVGLAFSYEKGIDKAGIVAYNLPLIATFNLNNNVSNGDHQDAMFYFSPGIKFYPTSSHGNVKYAIGPSLVIGAGEKTTHSSTYLPNPGNPSNPYYYEQYTTQSKFILGIMVSNSLNINPTEHFYLGLDFGFGFTYINRLAGNNDGLTGVVQSGFKIGYRF
ncbi:hypothetical protein [Flavipsychrobacter stenotrophus]|nr:hypothetical protein [Flavipsychrobacter stenotrophus]